MSSRIEWTDETWNPVTGCTKVSGGCEHCDAGVMAGRFWHGRPFTDVRCHEDRLALPCRWRRPRGVFVCSISDLFHADVLEAFVARVFDVMRACPQHTFQVLTNRAERLARVAPRVAWPAHVWAGVSVEEPAHKWRVDYLRRVPAAVRFLSVEPLLAPAQASLSA